jgi:SAM-dependent methyltransferase
MEYVGFDYSDRVVADASRERPGLKLFQADVTTYRPEAGSVDVVIIIGGLHHVPSHAAGVVASMADALTAGGCLVNLEPTNGNWLFGKVRERIYARNDLFEVETERGFPLAEYVEMFERAGLEHVDSIHPGLLAYVLYYNPDAFPALNIGGAALLRALFNIERPFLRSRLAAALSFATLSMWRKPIGQSSTRRKR